MPSDLTHEFALCSISRPSPAYMQNYSSASITATTRAWLTHDNSTPNSQNMPGRSTVSSQIWPWCFRQSTRQSKRSAATNNEKQRVWNFLFFSFSTLYLSLSHRSISQIQLNFIEISLFHGLPLRTRKNFLSATFIRSKFVLSREWYDGMATLTP